MEIEKLIEQLQKSADFEDYPVVAEFAAIIEKKYLREAATALSTLQGENEKLRVEAEGMRSNWYKSVEEIKKLRAELGKAKIERDMAAEDLLDAAIIPCLYCERNPGNGGACDMDSDNHEMFSCWKWRGIQKED